MQNADEIDRVIRDRQVRYRHEAYRSRTSGHPVRRWIGARLVRFGESIRGPEGDGIAPAMIDRPAR